MHDQAIQFVQEQVQAHHLAEASVRVLDLGGRKTSTSRYYMGPQPYELFKAASQYHVLDVTPGPDVDIVADATQTLHIANAYDVVVCTEVLEHVKDWPQILATAYQALDNNGLLILTCAGPGRRPHPATTEDWDPPLGEWYQNVSHLDVRAALVRIGYRDILTYQRGQDTQAVARK